MSFVDKLDHRSSTEYRFYKDRSRHIDNYKGYPIRNRSRSNSSRYKSRSDSRRRKSITQTSHRRHFIDDSHNKRLREGYSRNRRYSREGRRRIEEDRDKRNNNRRIDRLSIEKNNNRRIDRSSIEKNNNRRIEIKYNNSRDDIPIISNEGRNDLLFNRGYFLESLESSEIRREFELNNYNKAYGLDLSGFDDISSEILSINTLSMEKEYTRSERRRYKREEMELHKDRFWKCKKCSYMNYLSNYACLSCKGLKGSCALINK